MRWLGVILSTRKDIRMYYQTQEQLAIESMVTTFTRDEMLPLAAQWDREEIFPGEVLQKAAALGLAGIYVNAASGGSGLSRLDAVIIFEALARACPSTAAYLSIHNMVCWMIDCYGTTEQKTQWLPPLLSMEHFASYCLTEPDSGSDAASLKTSAKKVGNEYLINGAKAFISGGSHSDIYLTMVRTDDNEISCIIIPKHVSGIRFGEKEKKLGWRSQPTTMVYFDDCKVPCENLLGSLGQGFKMALSGLNGGRLNIGACSIGGAAQCLDYAKKYIHERKQFNHVLADFQTIQFKLAEMATQLHGVKLMLHHAANALDNQQPDAVMYCAMAKKTATDVGFSICNQVLQLYGGYGYLCEYPIERYLRDLRVHQILEGTNEIMQLIIARAILAQN